MRAIHVDQFGDPSVMTLRNAPDPEPEYCGVVVRLHAAGVNPVDTYIRSGQYASTPEPPFIPGMDGAGVVEAVGEGVGGLLGIGDRVWVSDARAGTYAERCAVPANRAARLPEHVPFEAAACVGVPYLTAWRALVQVAGARPGETVFIHGASGGVGTAAVQIGVAQGLKVICSAGTDAGAELVSSLGASVVRHDKPGYEDEVRRLAGGIGDHAGPAVIVEMLANANLHRDLSIIAAGGRVVIVGSRGETTIDPRAMMGKGTRIEGMSLLSVPPRELSECAAGVSAGLAAGWLKPVVQTTLPLEDAPRAHELVMQGGSRGGIVLTC